MEHPIVPYAHAAFCTGFAASGGPLTERVRAAHRAAIEAAIECCDDPHIIEATLHIGHLEGVWAKIFDRRTDLYATGLADFDVVWRKVWSPSGVANIVHSIKQQAGMLTEAKKDRNTASEEYAVALVLWLLQGLISRGVWQQLRLAVGDALASGRATGIADAMELLADKISAVGFNFSKAFADAKKMFDNDPQMLAEVDQWLSYLIQEIAKILGKKLAKMADGGASEGEMEQYVLDQLSDGNSGLFTSAIDVMIHGAITFGLLWFFRNMGVAQVWFITAGDDKVCPQCDAIEQNNPYSISDPPMPPIHPNCRCSLFTDDEIQASVLDAYLD